MGSITTAMVRSITGSVAWAIGATWAAVLAAVMGRMSAEAMVKVFDVVLDPVSQRMKAATVSTMTVTEIPTKT